jgi:hypothetical protein
MYAADARTSFPPDCPESDLRPLLPMRCCSFLLLPRHARRATHARSIFAGMREMIRVSSPDDGTSLIPTTDHALFNDLYLSQFKTFLQPTSITFNSKLSSALPSISRQKTPLFVRLLTYTTLNICRNPSTVPSSPDIFSIPPSLTISKISTIPRYYLPTTISSNFPTVIFRIRPPSTCTPTNPSSYPYLVQHPTPIPFSPPLLVQ